METLTACPLCNCNNFTPFIKCKDFTVSRETFQIVQCTGCCFKFTNPRPSQDEIGMYYESEDYISHSNSKKGLFNLAYQIVRKRSLKQKVKLIGSFKPETKTLLDIGCGTGEFLMEAKNSGWQVKGLEPSSKARDYGIKTNGLDVEDLKALYHIQLNSFDVITMWHVLEHVPNLHQTVQLIKSILKDSGTFLIAVPNATAYEESIYKENWAAYDVPRHLNHFSIETITKLMETNGLRVTKTQPMPFDSYYISMLSEKYKGAGFVSMGIQGMINGLKSNYAKSKDIVNSSSIIYIINKI